MYKLPEIIYEIFFINNKKINTVVLTAILENNLADQKLSNDKIIFNLDRSSINILNQETNGNLSKEEEIVDFKKIISKLSNIEIFALLSYDKKAGWFNYDSLKIEKNKTESGAESLLKQLK